ncbi:MAG TPA: hypothetical protein GX693_00390 [Firmicutes bacterium]|jgi:hypothetical protein|nr:hypothetical protein [Bacillota bacterium]
MPILMVSRDGIPSATKDVLKSLGISRVYIVGGTAVVSRSVENSLDDLTSYGAYRLGGADRFETSVEVAEEFFPNEDDCVLVGGLDANLADSIGACIYELPILYVKKASIPAAVKDYLEDNLTGSSDVKIMGGTAAISRDVADDVDDIIGDTLTVKSVTIETDQDDVTDVDNNAEVKVTLLTDTKGATIYYTTDGSDPTKNSEKYDDEFIVKTEGTEAGKVIITVKARAFKSGYNNSAITSLKITFKAAS